MYYLLKLEIKHHHLSHNRASKGNGSIPCLMSQTDLHRIFKVFVNMHAKKLVTSNKE